jgi:hypothetical protein
MYNNRVIIFFGQHQQKQQISPCFYQEIMNKKEKKDLLKIIIHLLLITIDHQKIYLTSLTILIIINFGRMQQFHLLPKISLIKKY